MDKLLESFSLGFLLRSGFSGVFFVLAFCIARLGVDATVNINETVKLSLVLPAALVAGVTFYTIHRSLLYPVIEWCMNSKWSGNIRNKVPLISKTTMELLLSNWKRSPETNDQYSAAIARHLSVWGDYAHFQYTSALCIAAGAFMGAITVSMQVDINSPVLVLAIIMLLAALVSDWRWHAFVDHIKDKEKDCSN
jgi:hypothetical protein